MRDLYWQRARLVFGAEMSPACKLVLLALSDHLGSNASCYPSVPRLQLRTGYSRRTVLRALEELEQLKAIQITRAPGRSNVYTLDLDWLRRAAARGPCPLPQRAAGRGRALFAAPHRSVRSSSRSRRSRRAGSTAYASC